MLDPAWTGSTESERGRAIVTLLTHCWILESARLDDPFQELLRPGLGRVAEDLRGRPSQAAPTPRTSLLGGPLQEVDGGGVDAVPQAGRLGPVIEDVTQVRPAVGADHLGATHAQGGVRPGDDLRLVDDVVEARPAAVGIELLGRGEQGITADHATV